jgi:protein TonB
MEAAMEVTPIDMSPVKKAFSPKSPSGSLLFSLLVHVALYGAVVAVLGLNLSAPAPHEEYIDLGYQTFDEPPPPAPEERKVVRSPEPQTHTETQPLPDNTPKELQDEKGDVAGTQKATAETNLGNESKGTAEATPYYKIKPKYPRAALVSGVEGWVMLEIDVTEAGEVENVRVVGGEQRDMFSGEARRAVSQWKYRPFMDSGGHPVRKIDHQVKVEFKLNDVEESGS